MSLEKAINDLIKSGVEAAKIDTNLISDQYHTFGELYEHRFELYIALCKQQLYYGHPDYKPWKSKLQSDGTMYSGWFLLGIATEDGKQITYHLPISRWDECEVIRELYVAPKFDGHTSKDVIERLKNL